MKLNYLFLIFLLSLRIATMQAEETWVKFGMANRAVLPRNYRTTLFQPANSSQTILFRGLNRVQASASGQFSAASLELLAQKIPNPLWIIDLREESHGFVNGTAICWRNDLNILNRAKTEAEIRVDEYLRLTLAQAEGTLLAIDDEHHYWLPCDEVFTEEDLAAKLGLVYLRFPCTDYSRPYDAQVEKLVTLIRSLPENVWLHFHCSAGIGRATTALTMYDMLINAPDVSFDEILLRQKLIGGKDFTDAPEEDSWKYPLHKERNVFLQNFYRYAQETADSHESWTTWLKGQS